MTKATNDTERIDSKNTINRTRASRETASGRMMIWVPADEASEEQVARARDESLSRASALVREGHLKAAERPVATARQLERKQLNLDNLPNGVIWR